MSSKAALDVIDERVRQLEAEDWDHAHDDEYINRELSSAALCYIQECTTNWWPWGDDDWKPKSRRENLVRAAALLIAEIERIDRLEQRIEKSRIM